MNLQRGIAAYPYYVMAHNHLHSHHLTLQQAVQKVANSPESSKEGVVILPPEKSDSYATDLYRGRGGSKFAPCLSCFNIVP